MRRTICQEDTMFFFVFVKIAAKASESEKMDDNSKGAASKGDVMVREFEEDDSLAAVNAIKKKVDNCCGRGRLKRKVPRREYIKVNIKKQKKAIQHSIMP